MAVVARYAGVLALIVVASCSFEIPPANHLNETELLMVRHSVEFGPLFPERSGPTFEGMEMAPIAEVLPGDRLRLEAVVFDADGRRLPDDELETLWLQCGFSCARPWLEFSDPYFDVPCTATDPYTTDEYCLLGTGDGAFELEVPEFGPQWATDLSLLGPHMSFYGVAAWDGRSVEDCWASRRGDQSDLEGCGFIYHDVAIGPVWTAAVHAASLGLEPPSWPSIDPSAIPPWVLFQPANRIPLPPALTVLVDGALAAPPIVVGPGAHIDVVLAFDPVSQSLQRTFSPVLSSYKTWKLVDERVYSRTETSGALRQSDIGASIDGAFSYDVDPDATPGTSRVLIIYIDKREAADVSTLEIEVQ